MDLKGKRIIVTGSARGMGAATVRAYVQAGADVIGMDVADDAGAAVSEQANTQGPGSAGFIHVDVADKARVESAFAEAVERLGGLDALAHPAAIKRASGQGSADAGHVGVDDWDRIFAVNMRGTMISNQVAYHHIKAAGGGAIINFGSSSGLRPEPSAAAYSASKGAVHSWTRTAAGTWGKDNVRVNAVLPAIRTPMFDETYASFSEEQKTEAYWRNFQSIALGQKYGDPERDLGPVILSSDVEAEITARDERGYARHLHYRVEGEDWEFTADPTARMPDFGEGVAKNPGQEGLFRRAGDKREIVAWWAWTETVPSHGELRRSLPDYRS